MPDKSWTLLGSRPVSDHRIFRLRYDRYRIEPAGEERDFVIMESPDWVVVVPLTPEGRVVMVRQYRHGSRLMSLEVPGGMVDPGEAPEEAALRELREETGYAAARIRRLGRVSPNPAIQNNWCHIYLAEGCHRAAEPQPELFEKIHVELRPLEDIPELIRREEIVHSLMINAFGLMGLAKRGEQP